ncbi:hypothetical protein [Escherichia coli]|uniref:hypothetical protein n=1 Tax=Escherichia coli TaxID=562 RepID=UPI00222687DF|nr:hypothetical protein [Escherichia coli]MCW3365104.1 hypothetical protein [Escherichia coli]
MHTGAEIMTIAGCGLRQGRHPARVPRQVQAQEAVSRWLKLTESIHHRKRLLAGEGAVKSEQSPQEWSLESPEG